MLRTDILALLESSVPGYSLPQEFYNDPAFFDLDMQMIFHRDWLFAIPACEIPETGNYVTHKIGRTSVIIVRGADGEIRAFHNVCRHRGSTLCSAAKGTSPKLVCAYHQWTYELDGRLLFARDMGDDFDPSQHGLKPVHCREASGLVFICLAAQAPDFDQFAEQSARYLAPHGLADAKVAHESTIIEEGNWKLVLENNRECYHCSGNHPSLCRTFLDNPAVIGNSDDTGLDAETLEYIARCEAAGAPSKYMVDDTGTWRYVRTPLVGDAESYTMSGKVAVTPPLSNFSFKNAGALLMFHYPATWNHFLSDHTILFRVTPISPTQTEVSTKWLVHKDAEEGRDYSLENLTKVWMDTNSEDKRVVENCQEGVLSTAYEPGPYSAMHESGVIQFVEWYTTTLKNRVSEQPETLASPLLRRTN
ncbi:aromatic ring-hydroxylating oxygenase subunit alpha [Granulosicoccus antarcticus]|uniref:Anthranilate 1,2-dioxygenase large subunit n=1 Tax=Granulosicoccus antarcticus IMCC3135 TaxID=1192854 RepID=A0A2Z2P421_9GAMM|nr:aromatic ring-hydroxylating dioxygenase subunit alpha [Granulosicoccus antarcticus]ASJ76160.1 Anthranilate 1,2-dioxygenase large subunit [Granulosicoccus antarcticus IMCC3135]